MELRDNGYYKTKKEQQSLPNNLFLFRQQANISQDKLAEVVDCNRRTIGYIEKGTHDRVYEEKSVNKNFYDNSWLVSI